MRSRLSRGTPPKPRRRPLLRLLVRLELAVAGSLAGAGRFVLGRLVRRGAALLAVGLLLDLLLAGVLVALHRVSLDRLRDGDTRRGRSVKRPARSPALDPPDLLHPPDGALDPLAPVGELEAELPAGLRVVDARPPEQEVELTATQKRRAADEPGDALAACGEGLRDGHRHRRGDEAAARRLDGGGDDLAHRGEAVAEDVARAGATAVECRDVAVGNVVDVTEGHAAGWNGREAAADRVADDA